MNGRAGARTDLRWPRLWHGLGWSGLVLMCVVSLLPMPTGTLDVPGSDKFGHLFAYFLLTFGHSQLGISQRALLWRAALFLLVGALIEVLQEQIGYRSGDPQDLLANAIGIVFGLVIGSSMPGWLQRLETRLAGALRRKPRGAPTPPQ